MRILEWEEFARNGVGEPAALTVGVFDGVHRGHRALIEKIKQQGLLSCVVTFRQHPRRMLRPEADTLEISTLDEKIGILRGLGVDSIVLIDFSGGFGKMEGEDFVRILAKDMRYLALGGNFRCGRGASFDAQAIKTLCGTLGVRCEIVPPVLEGGEPVSSSRIRAALRSGDRLGAEKMLGRKL
jgi:riboflavin kinase/FMN adenylyltransferase